MVKMIERASVRTKWVAVDEEWREREKKVLLFARVGGWWQRNKNSLATLQTESHIIDSGQSVFLNEFVIWQRMKNIHREWIVQANSSEIFLMR